MLRFGYFKTFPMSKNLFKVKKITLEQRYFGLCSSVIFDDYEKVFAHWFLGVQLPIQSHQNDNKP